MDQGLCGPPGLCHGSEVHVAYARFCHGFEWSWITQGSPMDLRGVWLMKDCVMDLRAMRLIQDVAMDLQSPRTI